jgi:hypothetical protein
MSIWHSSGGIIFLVCLETEGEPSARLHRRLAAWNARRCLGQCWMIAANTTSRIVYDSIAGELDDRDRILVSELDTEALWFNLGGDAGDFVHRARRSHDRLLARM